MVPYLLARLSYQVRALRSVVPVLSVTTFLIRLRSTPMAWVGVSVGWHGVEGVAGHVSSSEAYRWL